MTFENPLLLAGVAAAVLPLVIHLLGRARARELPWGATMLLAPSPGDSSVSGRWRERLLMATRGLVVAALAVALARPAATQAGPAEPGTAALVIVIDASPSMAHPEQNATRLDLARHAALDRLARTRRGEQAGLVVLGVVPAADVPLTPDLQAVASQLVALTPGPVASDLADGVRRARAMLGDAGIDGGEIVLIADRQRSAWEPLRQTATDPAAGPHVVALPVGSTDDQNAWIESVELLNPPAIVGTPMRVAVRLRNDGDAPQGGLTLKVSVSHATAAVGPVAVAAHGRARVVRTVTPEAAGPAVVTAATDPVGLPGDDTMRVAIDVLPPLRALLLTQPPPSATPPAFTSVAVPDWAAGHGVFTATTDAAAGPIGDVDVVVLSDLMPDTATVAAVEKFVAAGGALVLAPGPHVTPEAWNGRLWKSGFGFAPAASAVVDTPPGERPAGVPAFLEPSPDAADWTLAGLTRHWRLSPAGAERVLCRVGADPLVIERPFGRGRVCTVAAPLDGRWAGADYVGLVEAVVRRSTDRLPDRNVDLGVPLEFTVPGGRDRLALVRRPDNRLDRINVTVAGGQSLFRYARTDLPGRYGVTIGTRPPVDWFVRPEAGESELSLVDDATLATLLRPAGIDLQAGPPPAARTIDGTLAGLVAVAALLIVETALAGGFLPRGGGR